VVTAVVATNEQLVHTSKKRRRGAASLSPDRCPAQLIGAVHNAVAAVVASIAASVLLSVLCWQGRRLMQQLFQAVSQAIAEH